MFESLESRRLLSVTSFQDRWQGGSLYGGHRQVTQLVEIIELGGRQYVQR